VKEIFFFKSCFVRLAPKNVFDSFLCVKTSDSWVPRCPAPPVEGAWRLVGGEEGPL